MPLFYRCAKYTFVEGQVQPFWLTTADQEKLFCWHVLPLDVYLENEHELFTAAVSGEVAEELKGTVGEKLLSSDPESRVVVNFHGVGYAFVRFLTFYFGMLSLSSQSVWSCYIPDSHLHLYRVFFLSFIHFLLLSSVTLCTVHFSQYFQLIHHSY